MVQSPAFARHFLRRPRIRIMTPIIGNSAVTIATDHVGIIKSRATGSPDRLHAKVNPPPEATTLRLPNGTGYRGGGSLGGILSHCFTGRAASWAVIESAS